MIMYHESFHAYEDGALGLGLAMGRMVFPVSVISAPDRSFKLCIVPQLFLRLLQLLSAQLSQRRLSLWHSFLCDAAGILFHLITSDVRDLLTAGP